MVRGDRGQLDIRAEAVVEIAALDDEMGEKVIGVPEEKVIVSSGGGLWQGVSSECLS